MIQGAGNTITALALVLSTLRLRTEAPPGAEVIPMPRGPTAYGAYYVAGGSCRGGPTATAPELCSCRPVPLQRQEPQVLACI